MNSIGGGANLVHLEPWTSRAAGPFDLIKRPRAPLSSIRLELWLTRDPAPPRPCTAVEQQQVILQLGVNTCAATPKHTQHDNTREIHEHEIHES